MRSAKRLYAVLALVFAVLAVSHALAGMEDGSLLKVSILHMNDPHGHYVPYKDWDSGSLMGGFARARTVMAEIAKKNTADNRETLILMGGDLLMGSVYCTTWRGRVGVQLMNMMKFNAMVVGNHEFDYGEKNLITVLKPMMNFPLLSANIRNEKGERVFQSLIVKKFPQSSTRLVIIGLTTTDTPISTLPENVKGLVFDDPVKTAKDLLEPYNEQDLVIALTHLGLDGDRMLAASVRKIDVIIGGHSHDAVIRPSQRGNALICQAGAYSKYVGRLDLDVKQGRIANYCAELIPLIAQIKEDKKIASVINEYTSKLDARLHAVVGKTDVLLDGSAAAVRSGKDSDLGRLIGFVMALNSGSDVAVVNGGSIRSSLPPGDITMADVYTLLPFENTVVKVELTGEELRTILQRSADLQPGSGGKLQTFGVSWSLHSGKVRISRVGRADFDPLKTYTVATNNFLAVGGDGYDLFKERAGTQIDTRLFIKDLLIGYIRKEKILTRNSLDTIR